MYKTPSRRKKKNVLVRPNLTSLLDAIFIFIFFLLFSSDLKSLFEIPVDIPILSEKEAPPSKKVPLGLTLKINNSSLDLYSGTPLKIIKSIKSEEKNKFNTEELHKTLVQIKKENKTEKSIIINPIIDIPYEGLIKILDNIRYFRNTDESIFIKDPINGDVRIKELFNKIIFENIKS